MDYPSSSSSRFDASAPVDEDEQPGEGGGGGGGVVEREHMFDKVVTPSDVGKLNRLVIPKQHAEKYFPLDSSRDEKGLLLNFADRTGKAWRFRYSYWNSSQSYVMTKGWSRFVKEKKLDAGDIVSFHRRVAPVEGGGDKNTTTTTRFFIDWRRRQLLPEVPLLQFSIRPRPPPSAFILTSSSGTHTHTHQHPLHRPHPHHHPYPSAAAGVVVWDHIGGTPSYLPPMNVNVNVVRSNMLPYSVPQQYWTRTSTVNYFSSSASSSASAVAVRRHLSSSSSSDPDHQGLQHSEEVGGGERMVFDSVPVVQGQAAGKRLRLFGVDMDCPNNNNNNMPSRDYGYHHHHHHHNHHEDGYSSSSITTIPVSSVSSSSPHDRLLLHHRDHHHQAANHEDPLPLQLRLPVDKGKLSSSSSSSIMSLDLDM